VGPIETTDEVPAEIVQIAIDDGGNPRPLLVVSKNLSVTNYGDILAGIKINNVAVEHVFALPVRCDVYNSEIGALFLSPCYCPRMPRDGARSRCQMSALPRSLLSASRAIGAARGLADLPEGAVHQHLCMATLLRSPIFARHGFGSLSDKPPLTPSSGLSRSAGPAPDLA
jgi:hypothetical protein